MSSKLHFDVSTIEKLPKVAQKCLLYHLKPEAPLSTSASLKMKGHIKIGSLWLPFSAKQDIDAKHGLRWSPKVGWWPFLIDGGDSMWDGEGSLVFRVCGLRLVSVGGENVVNSGIGRLACESCLWCPGIMTPQSGAKWEVGEDGEVRVGVLVVGERVWLNLKVANEGMIQGIGLRRWGDVLGQGWRWEEFGGDVTGLKDVDGIRIAGKGTAGWFWGQENYHKDGEFFRFEVTSIEHK